MIERIRTPRPGGRIPNRSVDVPRIDTGGAWRPDWRMQDPSRDPKEPYGSESGSKGNDHGWSNCTMTSAALAYAYHVHDQTGPYGGDMRHHQSDFEGGTDLYDARDAWTNYGGQTLTIRNGAGWNALVDAHEEGRAIIVQGEGNVPGAESFDGGHACMIAPEDSEGKWLFGDPLATGWQWVKPSDIRAWMENLSSGLCFAVSKVVSSGSSGGGGGGGGGESGGAAPTPIHMGYTLEQMEAWATSAVLSADDATLAHWVEWMRAGKPLAFWDFADWDAGEWARHKTVGFPMDDAVLTIDNIGAWGMSYWRRASWH